MRIKVIYHIKSTPEDMLSMMVDARETRCAGLVITPTVVESGVEPRGFYRVRITHIKTGRDVLGGASLRLGQARMIAGALAGCGVDFTADYPSIDEMPEWSLDWLAAFREKR